MRFTHLIFDWNGTCIDDLPLTYGSVCEIFRRYGLEAPDLKTYRDEVTSDFMNFYYNHGIPRYVTAPELNAIRKEFFKDHWDLPKLYTHTLDALEAAKVLDLKIIIVSGEMPNVLAERIEQFGLTGYFDHVRGGAWPKHGVLSEVITTECVVPETSLYVGDTSEDVEVTKVLGLQAVAFTQGYNSRERINLSKPDFVIDCLRDLDVIMRGEKI